MPNLFSMKKPSICFFEGRMNGVEFYRSRQPMSMLAKAGWKVTMIPGVTDLLNASPEAMAMMTQSDILYKTAPTAPYLIPFVTMKDLDATAKEMGGEGLKAQSFIFDWDDNNFAIPPYNPMYLFYGLNNAYITLPGQPKLPLFEDGKTYWYEDATGRRRVKFDVAANRNNLDALQKLMQLADVCTSTTPYLSTELTKVRGSSTDLSNTFKVVPNAVDDEIFIPYAGAKDPSIINLVWTVSSSHVIDFNKIKPFIGELMRKYKNLHLHLVGQQFETNRDIPLSRLHVHTWVPDVPTYAAELGSFQADIGIAWVNDTEFNRNKSPLKAAEYMAMKIPVCTSQTVYGDHLTNGTDALLAATPEEFAGNLEKLILSADLRKHLVEGGDNTYRTKYSTDAVLPILERTFYSALSKS